MNFKLKKTKDNSLSETSIKYLSEALKMNRSLQDLELSSKIKNFVFQCSLELCLFLIREHSDVKSN